jgi:hypothetical protein
MKQHHPYVDNETLFAGLKMFVIAARDGVLKPHQFDIVQPCVVVDGHNFTSKHNYCGTVACIGGWAGLFLGLSPRQAHNFVMAAEEDGGSTELKLLFYPWRDFERDTLAYDQAMNMTLEQAVNATVKFLKKNRQRV